MLNSFNWKFYVRIQLNWNFVWLLIMQVGHEFTATFYFRTCSSEIIDIFPPHLKKKN